MQNDISSRHRARFKKPQETSMQHRPNFVSTACAVLLGIASSASAIAQASNCPFAVSGASAPTLARDALMLARYALGVRDLALIEKTGTTKSPSAAESSLIDAALRLDLDGDGNFSAVDAQIAARYLAGFSGPALTEGLSFTGATRSDYKLITQYINGGCVLPAPTDAQLKTIAEASLAANLRKAHPHGVESGNPNGGAISPSVPPGNAFTQGIPGDDFEQTALYSVPSITGEEGGFDIFNAVNPGDAKPGLRLTTAFYSGVNGRNRDAPGDQYLLGSASKAFFLGRTGPIDNDFARVMEMDVSRGGDEIVLHGNPSQYRFIETGGQEPGTAIFFNNNGVFDLIGFIDVHIITNANDPIYEYVTSAPSATPVPSLALDQFGGANADTITGLALDASGNIYALGFSRSDLVGVFPITNGTGQLFVAKYSAAGERVWLTRFGSTQQIGDLGWDIAVDATAAYVAARYIAPDNSLGGLKDAAYFKLDLATGAVLNEALWQGRGVQFPGAVALDNSEYVYFSGIGLDVAQPNPDGSQDPYIEKRRRSDLSLVKRKMFGGDAGNVPGAGGAANKEPWGGLMFIPSASGIAGEGTLFSAGWTMQSYEGTTALGGGDAFLVAFDQELNELWAEGWGSTQRDWGGRWIVIVSAIFMWQDSRSAQWQEQIPTSGARTVSSLNSIRARPPDRAVCGPSNSAPRKATRFEKFESSATRFTQPVTPMATRQAPTPDDPTCGLCASISMAMCNKRRKSAVQKTIAALHSPSLQTTSISVARPSARS
jgi:hypothetical protein